MRPKLTPDLEKKVIAIYFANENSPTRTAHRFNEWAVRNIIAVRVNKKNVMDIMKRFEKPAGVRSHAYTMITDENILSGVLSTIYQQPGTSIRKTAEELDMSVTTTHRIVRNVLKLYPYRLILLQKLSEFDKIVRVEACKRLLEVITSDKVIVWSDECTFYTDGHVNRWNCRIWDYERPESFYVESTQSARSVTVWAGMTEEHVFGPYFFQAQSRENPIETSCRSFSYLICKTPLENRRRTSGFNRMELPHMSQRRPSSY